jgi:hypothetical protein
MIEFLIRYVGSGILETQLLIATGEESSYCGKQKMKEMITHHMMQSSASLNPTQTSATWDTKHSALNWTSFADNRTLMMMKNQRGERERVCVCVCARTQGSSCD